MPPVIETGAGIANANCYGEVDLGTTLANLKAYATLRNVTLTESDAVLQAWLVLATDYLEGMEDKFVGCVVSATQSLSWPRQNVTYKDGTAFPANVLPKALIGALYQLVIEQHNGVVLVPTTDPANGGFVTSERIDVIETSYSEHVGITREPIMRAVDALLKPLLWTSGAFGLRTMRA